jgi:hypothetical protein
MNPNIIILTTTEVLEGLASGKYLDLEVRKLEDAARSTVIQLDNVIDGQQIQVLNAYEQLKSRGMEELDLAGLHKFHYHHNAGVTTVIHETNGTISITDFDGRVLFNAGSTVFGRIPELSEMRVLSDWEFDPDDFAAASYYEDEQPALATFEKFPEFPQEIKNKVWEIAGRNCEGREITLDEVRHP